MAPWKPNYFFSIIFDLFEEAMTVTKLRPGEKPPQDQDQVVNKRKSKTIHDQPQTSRSKAQVSKRKNKQPMVEENDPDEGAESENEHSPRPKANAKKKKKAPKKAPTYNQLMKWLKAIPFGVTRYPDLAFLEEVGLLEDVQVIFTNLGLGHFFTMAFPTYEILTCEFLSSLKVTNYDAPMVEEKNDLGTSSSRLEGSIAR